jgi:hypothetical protein
MPQQPGFVFRVMILGVPYKAKNVRVVDRATGQATDNSEGAPGNPVAVAGVGYAAKVPSVKEATITITSATYDSTDNPFAAPYLIRAQQYVEILVYPISGGPVLWDFPVALITEVTYEAEVRGLQPVTFTAESDGRYTAPGEA